MTATGVLNPNSQMKDYGRGLLFDVAPTAVQIRMAEATLVSLLKLRKSHLRGGDMLRARALRIVISGKIAELRKMKGG